jgi:DinB superfamily
VIDSPHKKFLILEEKRNELYNLLDKLDEKRLDRKPAENKWSVTQIVFHLVKAEQLSVISINKEMKNTNQQKTGLSALLRASLLKYSLKSPLKFKAPPILGKMPDTYDINELKTKWATIRNKLNIALDEVNEEAGNKYIFTHPYAGRLNIHQTMDFLVEHFNHHYRQIKNLSQLK